MSDLEKEINQLSDKLEKSAKTPMEILTETIKDLGPEGLRKALPDLSSEDKLLVHDALCDLKKAVEMDEEYQAKYVQGNINDTILQEDKADDDQDEKLVKPEAAKHNQQGNPVEGWEGQVIKAEKTNDEKKEKKTAKKLVDAVDKVAEDEAEEAVGEHEDKMHKNVKKSEVKEKLQNLKKAVEQDLGESATPELVKAEMKKRLLKEEDQVGDVDQMTEGKDRGDKVRPKELQTGQDNADAQKKVDSKQVKKADWTDPNDLLKACGNGQNFHFSVNGFYDEALEKSKAPEENLKKSVSAEQSQDDLNELIAKGQDATWGELECDRLVKAGKESANGQLNKSFQDDEIAQALGLTEEEAKQILGE